MLRAFTVRQPWGTGIIHLGKPVENRTKNIAGTYRGPVAIHTSKPKSDDLEYVAQAFATGLFNDVERGIGTLNGHPLLQGYVIGVVDLVDVHSASVIGGCGHIDHDCPEHGTCRRHCSPWAFGPAPRGGWFQHLVLANPRPLATPVPVRGALGLWTLPADVEAAVLAQIGGEGA